MEKVEKFKSGEELLDALQGDKLSQDDVYVGMVKESDKEKHVAFAPGSCEEWIDVPAELIGDVEVLRHVPCRDHSHPLVRLELTLEESNPLHEMVRQMFTSVVSRASVEIQSSMNAIPEALSSWSGPVFAPGSSAQTPQSNNLIFCRQRCIEWSTLFPNICNRWVWECGFGPIVIIWGSQVAER